MKHGKHYVDAAKLVDSTKLYEVNEALELACKTASAKFDETVELHVRLGVDGRHADQQVRGAVVLPNGTGKTVRVCAIAKGAAAAAAEAAGADIVGDDELIAKIAGGFMDFDVVVTTPDMMGRVGRLGKVLDTVMSAIAKAKPAAAKGTYFKSATIATTMGPGIRLNTLKYGV